MTEFIKISRENAILEIAFNRPKYKNALNLAMYRQAAQALREASGDGETRAVLFYGEGGHFSSGNDLGDFLKNPPEGDESPVFQFLLALRACEIPVLAAVEGYAIGIGTTMLLHCDLVWATESAKFQLPFVNLGLVPEAASSAILPALAGHRKAAELLYFGEFFDGVVASELGIINGVIEGDIVEFTRQKALAIAARPAQAIRETKKLMRAGDDEKILKAMGAEAQVFARRLKSQEFLAAVARFQK